MEKKLYRVTEKHYEVLSNGDYYIQWVYAGKEYWAQGEFFIDNEGYLHHSFLTPCGNEIEFTIKVL